MCIRDVVDELEWERPPSGRKLSCYYHRNKFTPSNRLHESFSTVEPMRRLPCFPRVKWCIFENIIFRIAQKVSTRFSTVSQKGGALGEDVKLVVVDVFAFLKL